MRRKAEIYKLLSNSGKLLSSHCIPSSTLLATIFGHHHRIPEGLLGRQEECKILIMIIIIAPHERRSPNHFSAEAG